MKNLQKTEFYQNIHEVLANAKQKIAITINFNMVEAYWEVGRMIVEEEQNGKARAIYGDFLIPSLSEQLTLDFGKNFHKRNLFYIKRFYLTFPKVNALRSQLSWTHYRLLMRIEKEEARNFYVEEAISEHWSTRTLERQINSFYYERLLASKDKKPVVEEATKNAIAIQPEDVIKDSYVLEAPFYSKSKKARRNLRAFLLPLCF